MPPIPTNLSTPASPTPETGDGDDLLLELRSFLASASNLSYGSASMLHRNADTALRLLRRLPAAKEGNKRHKMLHVFPLIIIYSNSSDMFLHPLSMIFLYSRS